MSFTGRQTSRKHAPGKRSVNETHDGEHIARAARVEELRRLVASGRYKVESHKLAQRILAKAMAHQG
jgi:anti-sigma28 factor (negative regulator of flagellin synthesis)